jgi:hypothetical protein
MPSVRLTARRWVEFLELDRIVVGLTAPSNAHVPQYQWQQFLCRRGPIPGVEVDRMSLNRLGLTLHMIADPQPHYQLVNYLQLHREQAGQGHESS